LMLIYQHNDFKNMLPSQPHTPYFTIDDVIIVFCCFYSYVRILLMMLLHGPTLLQMMLLHTFVLFL
jgi:hypothetical protein